jgi:hypothetical protein
MMKQRGNFVIGETYLAATRPASATERADRLEMRNKTIAQVSTHAPTGTMRGDDAA